MSNNNLKVWQPREHFSFIDPKQPVIFSVYGLDRIPGAVEGERLTLKRHKFNHQFWLGQWTDHDLRARFGASFDQQGFFEENDELPSIFNISEQSLYEMLSQGA